MSESRDHGEKSPVSIDEDWEGVVIKSDGVSFEGLMLPTYGAEDYPLDMEIKFRLSYVEESQRHMIEAGAAFRWVHGYNHSDPHRGTFNAFDVDPINTSEDPAVGSKASRLADVFEKARVSRDSW